MSNTGIVLISSGFMFFGLGFFLYDFMYKKNSIQKNGKIVGIEKHISVTRTGNRRSSSLVYRAIVSFIYDGNETFFTGGLSKSYISEKIGDKVKVEYIKNLPSSVRIANRKFMRNFGLLFLLISAVFLGISFKLDNFPPMIKMLHLSIPFIINLIAYFFMKRIFIKHGGITAFMKDNSSIMTRKDLDELDIFWSNKEIQKEENRVYKAFIFINPILIGLACWPFYIFSTKFMNRPYVEENLTSNLFNVDDFKIFFNYVMSHSGMQKEFLIAMMSGFFILALTYSFFYVLRKTN
ncbi:MAG: hypothetical protein ACI9IA_001325 [Enterobacterales bacterium]|jgi:hypothetical protein